MNISVGFGLLLVIVAVVMLAVAALYVALDGDNARVFPVLLSGGCAFGFIGVKLP